MGYWKERQIKSEEQGFDDIDTFVSEECINDSYMQNWIRDNAEGFGKCSYCPKVKESSAYVSMHTFMNKIKDTLDVYYDDAENRLPYDSETGEYWGTVYDNYDIIYELAENLGLDTESKLMCDIADILHDKSRCENDSSEAKRFFELLDYSWQSFCDKVKYQSRYFFNEEESNEDDKYSPLDILNMLANDFIRQRCFTDFEPNITFYRCRGFSSKNDIKTNVEDLCSPPKNSAFCNRLSAEGISVFYGAFDKNTAMTEVANSEYKFIVCAEFKNKVNIRCLDITKLQSLTISYFDTEDLQKQAKSRFYKVLNSVFSAPITGLKGVEYAPLQVFAEYCRSKFNIDGIVYNSSKCPDKKCIVLFYNHNHFLSKNSKMNIGDIEIYEPKISYEFRKSYIKL